MTDHQARIGIEFITVLGMPPLDYVALAADLGVRHIGFGLAPIVSGPDATAWSLRDDPALLHQVKAAMADRGVSVSVGEALIAGKAVDADALARDIDLLVDLGAPVLNMICIDSDRARAFDTCALFAEATAARGVAAALEFMPGPAIGSLDTALAALDHAGNPDFRLLVDAMHLFRSGATAADLAAINPARIGYVQLCDVPRVSPGISYGEEAASARLDPGEGELPLADFLRAVPPHHILGLEVPKLPAARAGIAMRDRLATCLAATRALLTDTFGS